MTTPTKPKPEQEDTGGLGLSPTQVIAGAGASVTSTVLASTTGVGGTLIGAGVGSVVSTVAAALYAHSIKRGRERITKVIPVGNGAVVVRDETRAMPALPPTPGTSALPPALDPRRKPSRFDTKLNRRFWTKVALAALGMFVVVMGAITAFEFLTQKPVSALVGDTETTRSTTLGTVTDDTPSTPVPEDQQQEDTPVTTTEEAPRPDDEGAEPTTTPEPEQSQPNEQGGQDITRTAESTAGAEDEAEDEVTTEAPAPTTSAPEPTSEATAPE